MSRSDFSMSMGIEQVLLPELGRDERLLWSGKPRQGVRLRSSDAFMIPFSLIWAGVAGFGAVSSAIKSGSLFNSAMSIPFVLIGLYLVVGRFFYDSYLRAHTFYGVTGQRAIILSGIRNREVRSVDLHRVPEISLSERADKSGTLTFGPGNPAGSEWAGGRGSRGRPLSPTFEMIEKVRDVYDLIRKAQAATG